MKLICEKCGCSLGFGKEGNSTLCWSCESNKQITDHITLWADKVVKTAVRSKDKEIEQLKQKIKELIEESDELREELFGPRIS